MTILGVAGASGGVGVSTLAVALGVVAADRGLAACVVDGDFGGGGLQVTAGVEHLPGHRWPHLSEVEGRIDGDRLIARLPSGDGCPVLSAGRMSHLLDALVPERIPEPAVRDVLAGLDATCDLVVVDRGRSAVVGASVGLLLVALSARGLADAEAWLGTHGSDDLAGIITRAPKVDDRLAVATGERLALPLLGVLEDDRRVRAAERRGAAPGSVRRGSLRKLAERLVTVVAAAEPSRHTARAGSGRALR